MSRISILKYVFNTARAGLVIVGMLSPVHAAYQQDIVGALPVLPKKVVADHSSAVLTAHLPWLAPIGHRQPHLADVPQLDAVSTWERRQQQLDQELDRKLIICRGC